MPDLSEIIRIKRSVEADLLRLPGVTGVGVGFKYVGGVATDQIGIAVFVQEKKAHVPPSERIATIIQGVITDVMPLRPVLLEDPTRHDPLMGGLKIMSERPNGTTFGNAGTGGMLVHDNDSDELLLLSNAHVMGPVGNRIHQPVRNTTDIDFVGTVVRSTFDDIDAAVCDLKGDRGTQFPCEILDSGVVRGTAVAQLSKSSTDIVRKRGFKTGLTVGHVHHFDVISQPDNTGKTYTDIIVIANFDIGTNPAGFVSGGDSGSVVVNSSNRVIGLLYAGSQDPSNPKVTDGKFGFANPIQKVFTKLNIRACAPEFQKPSPHDIFCMLFPDDETCRAGRRGSGTGMIVITPQGDIKRVPPEQPEKHDVQIPTELNDLLMGLAISERASMITDAEARDQIKRAALELVCKQARQMMPHSGNAAT